ncbi:hypothetical protein [Actinoplanes sp. GCM10030250]|uniref:hypothetical protein n=1 Tax=Actinoplanes sp. GCM10030250 TaxID=3273376 RepID=UPI003609A1D8
MSRHDLKELGEYLDSGEFGLVVVAVTDMGSKVERAMRQGTKKVAVRELKADPDEIEQDAKIALGGATA